MDARALLADLDGFEGDPETVGIDDEDVFELLDPAVKRWWVEQFGEFVPENGGFFTPPQKGAIPHVHAEENALICAPTGSGKTLASFTAILNELFARERESGLENSVYCLYVSPLKSLANDIHRNLEEPLSGIREVAEEAGVPVRQDAPTARALYATVEIGEEIGVEHYAQVAAAIRFADDMRRRARRDAL